MKHFITGLSVTFVALILLMTVPAFAISYSGSDTIFFADTNSESTGVTATPTTTSTTSTGSTALGTGAETTGTGDACSVSKLDPKEAAALMNLTKDGYQGGEMTDGQPDTNNNETLGDIELIGDAYDGESAVKVKAPSEITPSNRFAFLADKTIIGPWGIGVIMDDTLRVGRCEGLPQEQCRINGDGLTYRNSGEGFVSDWTNALESLNDSTTRLALNMDDEEFEGMKNNYIDSNAPDFLVVKLTQEEQITNSILTEKYIARQATNCNNGSCAVSTYSAFDKYYNAWFSTEMVVSAFGPALFNQAKKVFGKVFEAAGMSGTLRSNFKLGKLQPTYNKWFSKYPANVMNAPSDIIGKARISKYQNLVKEYGLGPEMTKLTVGQKMFSAGAAGYTDELLAAGSAIQKYTPQQKAKFYEAIEHLSQYTKISNIGIQEAAAKRSADLLAGIPKATADIEYARTLSKHMVDWDDVTFLDFPKWLKEQDALVNFNGYGFRRQGLSGNDAIVEISTAPSFNMKAMLQEFSDNPGGGWRSTDWGRQVSFDVNPDGSLKLFKLKPSKTVQSGVSVDDLRKHVASFGEGTYSVRLPTGDVMPLNQQSIESIVSNPALGGNVDIVSSAWSEEGALTAADFAERLSSPRIGGRVNVAEINLKDIEFGLREQGFPERKAFSLLDAQYAREANMVKDYFKKPISVGLYKGTAMPFMYWNLKRGFGFEEYSAYMLPDSWTTLTVVQGVDQIYNDSYIDFFANAGSDQGDMFARVINAPFMIWQEIVDAAAENVFPTGAEWIQKMSGEGGLGGNIMRDEVFDLAFYAHNENCADCVTPIGYEEGYFFVNGFKMGNDMQAFLVEAATEDVKTKEGTTIVAFTHHSNLEGKSMDTEGGEINLVDGRLNDETCDQALRSINLGWAGTGAGGILAVGESMAYFMGIGPGLMATGVQQLMLADNLQDCVDDKEGYYIHFYAPPSAEKIKKQSQETLSNETVSESFSKMAEGVEGAISTDNQNVVSQAMGKIKDQFQGFAKEAKAANILQANIEMLPPNFGTILGEEMFYFWYKGNAMPSGYDDTSVTVMTDGNTTVEINKASDRIRINGETVVSTPDHTRMTINTGDMRIPAQVVPYTLTKVAAPNTSAPVFELNTNGEIFVRNSEVLDCIQLAVKAQTGIEYSGDELTQVFGDLSALKTDMYGSVSVVDGKIYMEGKAPRAQGGPGSIFVVDGFWQSTLKDSGNDFNAGKFVAMTFKHGTIVLKEETNELIVWLRQHKDSVLTDKDVAGLKANLTTVIDPETECPVPAIDLEAMPFPNDELGQKRVDNFNTSMDHLGPFTQFTTDKKIFIFYSKLDPETGECKDYFKVIDKETGEVLTDQEIVGGLKQAEDGTISFKTADGKNHELKFDAENGVPKVSYNGQPPETLRTAQGPNGSFWYDPETGLWYPENGMQIPMNQSYKDNGGYFSTEDGKFSGQAGNPMTFNIGSQQGGAFSVPSLPETALGLILFISLFLAISFISTTRIRKKKK